MTTLEDQRRYCQTHGAEWLPAPSDFKVSVARTVLQDAGPIHGARREAAERESGWYLWAGEEYSEDPAFFVQVSVASLREWCPPALKFLGLPAGWRFTFSDTVERAWFDPALLDT